LHTRKPHQHHRAGEGGEERVYRRDDGRGHARLAGKSAGGRFAGGGRRGPGGQNIAAYRHGAGALRARDPDFTSIVESDPAYKVLEVAAYRELLLRARVNDACRAVHVASSAAADLDQLAALFGVTRKTITPAAPDAIPPVEAVMESDADLRARVILAPESLSTAGPPGAYRSHALRVADVRDVSVESPTYGAVVVTILSRTGDGAAPAATLAAVRAILNHEDVRPLTDHVTVQSAEIVTYAIAALLYTYAGPAPEVVMQTAHERARAYAAAMHRLGNDITHSGLYAALHVPGVQRVEIVSPQETIIIQPDQAPHCTAITLTHAGAAQ
jgi:phage-related baseplate assembly protein